MQKKDNDELAKVIISWDVNSGTSERKIELHSCVFAQ